MILFKDQGVGVGLRSPHIPLFLKTSPALIKWVEVISENYMPWQGQGFGKSLDTLLKIKERFPIALHGVSMNLGSSDDIDRDYLQRLKQLIKKTNPLVVSDHLSWTGVNGENLHDLLPIPYTEEALIHIADKISQVQNEIGQRILIENPSSYLEFQTSEMSESIFIKELLNKADCGLLLDVNNVYVSSVNHGFDAKNYLKDLPAHRIGQIHLAGHSKVDNYLIDTHDAPVCEEVWSLYEESVKLFGKRSVMLERDDNIPEWSELELELLKIQEIYEKTKSS